MVVVFFPVLGSVVVVFVIFSCLPVVGLVTFFVTVVFVGVLEVVSAEGFAGVVGVAGFAGVEGFVVVVPPPAETPLTITLQEADGPEAVLTVTVQVPAPFAVMIKLPLASLLSLSFQSLLSRTVATLLLLEYTLGMLSPYFWP